MKFRRRILGGSETYHFRGIAKSSGSFVVKFNNDSGRTFNFDTMDDEFDRTYNYKLTSLYNAFSGQTSLQELTITELNTSNVTDMNSMFDECRELTSLSISNFDTSNVTNMQGVFLGCRSLTSLDVSKWNTSNVTNMSAMFAACSGLTELDLSNFDTSNVTNMTQMFSRCHNLISLDLANFDTRNVTKIDIMFGNCANLISVDLSKFEATNFTKLQDWVFSGCTSLNTIKTNCNFKKWCIENADRITLPEKFKDPCYSGWITSDDCQDCESTTCVLSVIVDTNVSSITVNNVVYTSNTTLEFDKNTSVTWKALSKSRYNHYYFGNSNTSGETFTITTNTTLNPIPTYLRWEFEVDDEYFDVESDYSNYVRITSNWVMGEDVTNNGYYWGTSVVDDRITITETTDDRVYFSFNAQGLTESGSFTFDIDQHYNGSWDYEMGCTYKHISINYTYVVTNYDLTLTLGPNVESIMVNGTTYTSSQTIQIASGTSVSWSATAESGYIITPSSSGSFVMDGNKSINVSAVKQTVYYTLTISVGEGVSYVEIGGEHYRNSTSLQYNEGYHVQWIAYPETNYEIDGPINGTIVMDSDKTLNVTASKKSTYYTFSWTLGANVESIEINGTVYTSSSSLTFESGTSVTYVTTAKDGYEISNYSGETFIITSNKSISVTATQLVPSTYTVTFHFNCTNYDGWFTGLNYKTNKGTRTYSFDGLDYAPSESYEFEAGTILTLNYDYLNLNFSRWSTSVASCPNAFTSGGFPNDNVICEKTCYTPRASCMQISHTEPPETITVDQNLDYYIDFTADVSCGWDYLVSCVVNEGIKNITLDGDNSANSASTANGIYEVKRSEDATVKVFVEAEDGYTVDGESDYTITITGPTTISPTASIRKTTVTFHWNCLNHVGWYVDGVTYSSNKETYRNYTFGGRDAAPSESYEFEPGTILTLVSNPFTPRNLSSVASSSNMFTSGGAIKRGAICDSYALLPVEYCADISYDPFPETIEVGTTDLDYYIDYDIQISCGWMHMLTINVGEGVKEVRLKYGSSSETSIGQGTYQEMYSEDQTILIHAEADYDYAIDGKTDYEAIMNEGPVTINITASRN